jgi:hypothetical protein
MHAECNEPSLLMALIGFGYQVVSYELALIRFSHALVHSGSFVVRHPVQAASPGFDFTCIFGEFILIFARPGFSMGQQVAERFRHRFTTFLSGSGQVSLLPSAGKCQIQKVATGDEGHTLGGRRRFTALRLGDRASLGCNRLAASRRGLAGACGPRASSISIRKASTTER